MIDEKRYRRLLRRSEEARDLLTAIIEAAEVARLWTRSIRTCKQCNLVKDYAQAARFALEFNDDELIKEQEGS